MTSSPHQTATRPRRELSEISRKGVRQAMGVPSHFTFVGGVAVAVRTGGLHTLANAILQQKKVSRLKREMCPSVGSQIAFLTVLFKLVSPWLFFQ